MVSRVHGARDLDSGLELRHEILGNLMKLQLHHIFPKAKLYKRDDFTRPEVNSLANFMFLTQATNLQISDQDPERYFAHYEERNPGVLASQWIPMDERLWRYEHYRDFLAARRQLLADAANTFLDSLIVGKVPFNQPAEAVPVATIVAPSAPVAPAGSATDEEVILEDVRRWVEEQQLPAGELYYELVDETDGSQLAVLDLAWPDGLQTGLSGPVALLLDESPEVEKVANQAGYRYFTDIDAFQRYVTSEVLVEQQSAD